MGLKIKGSTSGSIEIDVPAVAGTDTAITIPATTGGEFIVSDASGNVDLGALDISGSAAADSVNIDSSGRLLVGTSSSSSNARAVFLGNSGGSGGYAGLVKVSFDTTAPGSTADLGRIAFTDSGQTEAATISGRRDSGTWTSGSSQPTALVFNTTANGSSSPTERMSIRNDGDIWMNSSNGSSGTQGIVANSTGLLTVCTTNTIAQIINVNSGGGTRTLITFRTDGTDRGSITSNGSTTSYNTSSDYRLKENVVPLTGAADRVNQLQVRRFNFIADPDTTVDGFIAHEAQSVVPEAVTGTHDEVDDDGNPVYQGIDQSKLVPLLTAALQEALAKIETLEQRLTDAGIA